MSARSGLVGKILLAPFGAISGHFLHGPEKCKKCQNFAYFPWWANGPYSPGVGPGCYPPEVAPLSVFTQMDTLGLQQKLIAEGEDTQKAYNERAKHCEELLLELQQPR